MSAAHNRTRGLADFVQSTHIGPDGSKDQAVRNIDRRQILSGLAAFGSLRAIAPAVALEEPAPLLPSLRRGFNLPDQVPLRAGRHAHLPTLRRLHDLGMTHIRLPVFAETVLPDFASSATRDAAYRDLDRALERLLALGYSVSVDMHPGQHFDDLQRSDPTKAHAALRRGWNALAPRLKTYPPTRVLAELLNEPATTDDLWRPFAETLAADVRSHLPDTTIVVGPAPFQRIEPLAQWTPFADRNILYAAHFYDPMIFTHQGLTWDETSPYAKLADVPFPLAVHDAAIEQRLADARADGNQAEAEVLQQAIGKAWNAATIKAQFAPLAAWSATHKVPVVVNEFGALRFKAPRASRVAWIGAVRAAVESYGFGWAHWDYDTGFGLLDEQGAIDAAVIGALLPHA